MLFSKTRKSTAHSRRKRSNLRPHRIRAFEQLEKRNLLATYVVNSLTDDGSGGTTLREALEAASDNVEVHSLPAGELNDIIRFDESLFENGPATLTLRPDLHVTQTVSGALRLSPNGRNEGVGSISIIGPGADLLTIDAGGAESIFVAKQTVNLDSIRLTGSKRRAIVNYRSGQFPAAASITLENVLIDNNPGGAVEIELGQLTVRESTIENNGFSENGTLVVEGGAILAAGTSGFGDFEIPTVLIEDSVIRGNQAIRGGAIAINEGQVIVLRSTIELNSALVDTPAVSRGGGIYLDPTGVSQLSVYESIVANNSADLGGGIYVEGQVARVRDSLIESNTASESGGGVYVGERSNFFGTTEFILSGSTIQDNAAPIGAGIDNDGGSIEVINSSFVNNEATLAGGAIASRVSQPGNQTGVATTISNTTISGNRSTQGPGAGVYHDPNTISGDNTKLRLINTTITLNESGFAGAGLAVEEAVGIPTTKLVNSIIAGNSFDGADSDLQILSSQSILVDQSRFNLIGDPGSAGGLIDDRDGAIGSGNIVGDPAGQPLSLDRILFRSLADNLGNAPLDALAGSETRIIRPAVHSLKLDSPAIDAGTPFFPSAGEGIVFDANGQPVIPTNAAYADALRSDQRGYPFLRRDSSIGGNGLLYGRTDIGAYETQLRPVFTSSELVVSTLEDENDGDYSFGDLSLREAVLIANLSPDENGIRFAPSLIDTDEGDTSKIHLDSPIEIVFDLTISGPGPDLLQLSGQNQTRILEIGPLSTTDISGVALVDGRGGRPLHTVESFDGFNVPRQGGALFNAGNTTLHDVLFSDNTSVKADGNGSLFGTNSSLFDDGGGAIVNTGVMRIHNADFIDNVSETNGGAIANVRLDQVSTTTTSNAPQENSLHVGPGVTFSGNESRRHGGAISSRVPLTIVDTQFTGNLADRHGGAVSIGGTNLGFRYAEIVTEIRRSEFIGNQSREHGGAISQSTTDSEIQIFDSTIDGNRAGSSVSTSLCGVPDGVGLEGACGGGIFSAAHLTIERSTISNNLVSSVRPAIGGGIAMETERFGARLNIRNSTISGNEARGNDFDNPGSPDRGSIGGGIFMGSRSFGTIIDSTITRNRVRQGALSSTMLGPGLAIVNGALLSGSIVSENWSTFQCASVFEDPRCFVVGNDILRIDSARQADFFGPVTAHQPNIIPGADGINDPSRLTGATTITTPTNLGPLQDNGGRTFTHAIDAFSPAIDNGERIGLLDQRGFPATDQANPFFDLLDSDGQVGDIGAFESSQVTVLPFTQAIRNASQFGSGNASVFGQGFDDGLPNSTLSKEPGFLGLELDTTFTVGPGVYEDPIFGTDWGGEATVDLDSRLGIEYGYYVNSGSVDTFFDGLFGYSINQVGDEFVIGTGSTITEGSLYTISPRVGAYADLVFEFNAELSGRACVVKCIEGSIPISIDESVSLFSINRQREDDKGNSLFINRNYDSATDPMNERFTTNSEGGLNPPAFDGQVQIAGLDLRAATQEDIATGEEDVLGKLAALREEIAEASIDEAEGFADDFAERIRAAKAEEKKLTSKSKGAFSRAVGNLQVDFQQTEELLGVEAELSYGIGSKSLKLNQIPGLKKAPGLELAEASLSKKLGKIALTVPEIQLTETEMFENGVGTLSASTDDFAFGSELDARRQIASLTVDVGAFGPFGKYDLSAGPIDIEATTVSYEISPRLALSQDVQVEPFFDADHQASFDFTFTGGGTIDVFVGSATTPVAVTSGGSVSFMPGTEIRVDSDGKSIDVTPSISVGNRFSNDIGLDIDVKGVLEILRLKMLAFDKEIFDLGPLYENTHALLDSFDLGSIFSSTFNLPSTTTQLDSFSLSADGESIRDGKTPGGALRVESGVPTNIAPVAAGTTYFSVPLIGADGVLNHEVLFETTSTDAILIRPPYDGLTIEILDDNDLVLSSFDLDVAGTTFANGSGPQRWRLSGFENLLGSEALFGVQFASAASRSVTVTVQGGATLDSIGVNTEKILTDAKQAEFESAANLFVRQFDLVLDIDGDGFLSPTTDGTLIARFMDGTTGDDLIAGITSTDVVPDSATRTDAAEILAYLQNLVAIGRLDIDDNGVIDPSIDGVLILRHLSGIGGSATTQQGLTDGLDLNTAGGNRTLPADIRAFIDGGQSPTLNQTFADDVLSLSDREGIPTFRVSSDAVDGSSPFAPVLTSFAGGTGVYNLTTYAEAITFDETFLVDANDPTIRTVVRTGATGTPGRTIDFPEEFTQYLSDPFSPDIDTLVSRFVDETRTADLGIQEPLFVKVPDAAGYEFSLPAGVTVSQLHFDPSVGGNLFIDHSESSSGADVDFDLFIPSTSEWFQISMSEPFDLPASVSSFEIYARPVLTRHLSDPQDQGDIDLDLTVGLMISGPATPSPNLTVNVLSDRQDSANLNEIQIGNESDATEFETRIARDGAYLEISTNGQQTPLSSQGIVLDVSVLSGYPIIRQDNNEFFPGVFGVGAWTFNGLAPGLYQVSTSWTASSNLSTAVEYYVTEDPFDVFGATATVVDQQLDPNQDRLETGQVFQNLVILPVLEGQLVVTVASAGPGAVSIGSVLVQRVDKTVRYSVEENPVTGVPYGLTQEYARDFAGRSSVTVVASDIGGNSTTDSFSVTVADEPFLLVPTNGLIDQDLPSGVTQHTIDVSTVFDGQGLVLTVETNDPLVTASISNDLLTIDFVEETEAQLILTARDGTGMLRGTDTFVVSTGVADPNTAVVLEPISDKIIQLGPVHIYELGREMEVADSRGGPDLSVRSGGRFQDGGLRFDEDRGPSLALANIDPREYSIELDFFFDDYVGFQKIIDFKDGQVDAGLYSVGSKLQFFPATGSVEVNFQPGEKRRLIMTRNGDTDLVRIFLDSQQVLQFTDSGDLAVLSAPDRLIRFFVDDGLNPTPEAESGFLDQISIYDRVHQFIPESSDFSTQYTDRTAYNYSSLFADGNSSLPNETRTDRALMLTGKSGAMDTLILDTRTGPLYQPFSFHGEFEGVVPAGGWTDKIVVEGEGLHINLNQSEIQGVGRIDLRGSGPNSLTASADALYNNDWTGNPLLVIADADDMVVRSDDTTWTQLPGQQTDAETGFTFDVFTTEYVVPGNTPWTVVLWVSDPNSTSSTTEGMAGPEFEFPISTVDVELVNEFEKPGQIVLVPPSDTDLITSEKFTVDVLYNTNGTNGLIPPAVLVEVHYDSSRLQFSDLPFVLNSGLVNDIDSESPEFETVRDGSVRTDRTMIFSFTDFLGAWPADATDSVKLATIEFQAGESASITDIRLTGLSSNGFIFDASDSTFLSIQAADYGDAPGQYGVTLENGGAHHLATGPRLGAKRDTEQNGQPSADADGDDIGGVDDEDGVMFGLLQAGAPMAAVNITMENSPTALIDAWIDFNGDGNWSPAEQILISQPVNNPLQTLNFDMPESIAPGDTYARVRISTEGNLGPGGFADDGEVEDYLVSIIPPLDVDVIRINDGSANRSQVTSLEVTFSREVDHNLLTTAFEISNTTENVEVGVVHVIPQDVNGRTIATLTFSQDSTHPSVGQGDNSLIDGNYLLNIDSTKVVPNVGQMMEDDVEFGATEADAFFRFFGDSDGDRDVDGQDYGRFGLTFLKSSPDAGFNSALDFDGDGDVDGQDYGQFGLRFLKSLPF